MAVDPSPISVRDLSKTYRIPVRDPGLSAALKSIVRRRTEEVEAVKEISFEVASGEIVGFLGPNGAGKTTTLKMMSGLLNPSAGQVSVLGAEPFKRERSFLRQITLVMGNRNQLVWDIPVSDSFERNRAIYRIPAAQFLDHPGDHVILVRPCRQHSDDLPQHVRCSSLADHHLSGLVEGSIDLSGAGRIRGNRAVRGPCRTPDQRIFWPAHSFLPASCWLPHDYSGRRGSSATPEPRHERYVQKGTAVPARPHDDGVALWKVVLLKKRRNDAAKNDHESGKCHPGDQRRESGLSSGGSQHVHTPWPTRGTSAP